MLAGGQMRENCAGVILLVDDSWKLRGLAAETLRGQGFGVLEASDAEEAIAIYRERADSIGMVITDLEMPGKSGLELANFISVRNASLPLLFVSLHSSEVLSRLLSPSRDFLSKPFSPAALVDKVRQVFRRKELGSEFNGAAALPLL